MDDGIQTLRFGQNDITLKGESLFEGPQLLLNSADAETSKGLHTSRRFEPDMTQARTPMNSAWQDRRNDAFRKERKRLKQGFSTEDRDPIDDVSNENSEEEVTAKKKTALISHSTISTRSDLKPRIRPNLRACSHANLYELTDMKIAQFTDTLHYPPMSPPTCDIDRFESADDSLSSHDSIF